MMRISLMPIWMNWLANGDRQMTNKEEIFRRVLSNYQNYSSLLPEPMCKKRLFYLSRKQSKQSELESNLLKRNSLNPSSSQLQELTSKYSHSQVSNGLMKKLKCKTEHYDKRELNKQKLLHRCITEFKTIYEDQGNAYSLPFIVSLRSSPQKSQDLSKQKSQVQVQPFEVALKQTANQKVKKSINDINSSNRRIYQASYRWKSRHEPSILSKCNFDCNLRSEPERGDRLQKERPNFSTLVRPRRNRFAQEERGYQLHELICRHQEKVFKVEGLKRQ